MAMRPPVSYRRPFPITPWSICAREHTAAADRPAPAPPGRPRPTAKADSAKQARAWMRARTRVCTILAYVHRRDKSAACMCACSQCRRVEASGLHTMHRTSVLSLTPFAVSLSRTYAQAYRLCCSLALNDSLKAMDALARHCTAPSASSSHVTPTALSMIDDLYAVARCAHLRLNEGACARPVVQD